MANAGHAVTDRQAEVVVVGAGLAGLVAARQLRAYGVDALTLEARDRVGGRTWTVQSQTGAPIDMGAQWIGPNQKRLAALADAVGATTFKTYDTGNNIEHRDGVRRLYSGAIPLGDPAATMEAVEALVNLNMLAYTVPLEAPWEAAQAAEWDAQTVETWLRANLTTEGARKMLTLAVRSVFCAEPRDLSLLHFLFYVHSGNSLNELVGVTRGAQESRFHEGAQSVALKVAAALGDRVLLNALVRAIRHDAEGVRVSGDTVTVTAKAAIIALPPTLAGRIQYDPPLPYLRDQLTQRVPMGTVIKLHCVYPTPFWREEGLSGQMTSDSGIVSVTFDNSPASGTPGVLLGFIEGDEGRRWGGRDATERRAAVLACLVDFFGPQAGAPAEYIEQFWAAEEYTRGCYGGYMPPGVWTMYGPALRVPVGRLHWAGTETATEWMGYMDGAVQSGERAAREVLESLGIYIKEA